MKIISTLALSLFAFILSINAYAQTEKGNLLLGASSSFNFGYTDYKWKTDAGTEDDGDQLSFSLSPQIGFFAADNFALGASLPINVTSSEGYSSTSIAFSPFVRKYFGSHEVIRPFIHGDIGYGQDSYSIEVSSTETIEDKNTFFRYGVGGGMGLFLNDKVSVDIGLLYQHSSSKDTDDADMRRIISSINLGVGFIIIL